MNLKDRNGKTIMAGELVFLDKYPDLVFSVVYDVFDNSLALHQFPNLTHFVRLDATESNRLIVLTKQQQRDWEMIAKLEA